MLPAESRALRIVLFGRCGAGKTSLLGALALAAADPEHPPSWRLVNQTDRLAELRRRVLEDNPQPTITPEQIVSYPIRFHDFIPSSKQIDVLLIDCDGNAAMHLLGAEHFPDHGGLAGELLRVDALVLVVPGAELHPDIPPGEPDFAQLERFLTLLEEERGRKVQLSGLPVLLAMTKSDLLARAGDWLADWQARVAQQVEQIDRRFEQFRQERIAWSHESVFGRVMVLPALATATHPPRGLTSWEGAVIPPGPAGVVELFQQSLEAAVRYRRGQRRSTARLLEAVLLVILLIGGMIGFGIMPKGDPLQADRETIQAAIDSEVVRYQQLRDQAAALADFTEFRPAEGGRVPWSSWDRQVEEVFTKATALQPDPDALLPGAERATWRLVVDTDPVQQARGEWLAQADRLQLRRDLVLALGLVESKSGPPPLLAIPAAITIDQCRDRWQDLPKEYSRYADWTLDDWPFAVRRELLAVLETRSKHLLEVGRQAILAEMNRLAAGTAETPGLWRQLRGWLDAPAELKGWRELTGLILRLADPRALDPVDALRHFLDRQQFDVELRRLVLKVPAARKIVPAGKLKVYHGIGDQVRTTLSFSLQGEGWREPNDPFVRWIFVPDAGEALTYQLGYRPGDTFWADLPVKVADKDGFILTWSVARSRTYQFERLSWPPRLHRLEQLATAGDLVRDAELMVAAGIVPRMPNLLPVVKLGK